MKRTSTIALALLATVLLTAACGAPEKIGSAATSVQEAAAGKPLEKVYACNREVEVDQYHFARDAGWIALETEPPSVRGSYQLDEWKFMIIERNNLVGTEDLNGRKILVPRKCGKGKQKETAK